jgi:hypothetical protein
MLILTILRYTWSKFQPSAIHIRLKFTFRVHRLLPNKTHKK